MDACHGWFRLEPPILNALLIDSRVCSLHSNAILARSGDKVGIIRD